jgi:hypothetical protein
MRAQDTAELEPDPIEIDPRDCEFCGLTVDKHRMVDDGNGPLFYCEDDLTANNDRPCPTCGTMQIADQELHEWTNRWVKRAEDRRSNIVPLPPLRHGYRTPQSTVETFFYMVRLEDGEKLRAWLRNHPRDAAFLLKLWKDKNAR